MLFSKSKREAFAIFSRKISIAVFLLLSLNTNTAKAEEPISTSVEADSLVRTFSKLINNNAERARLNVERAIELNNDTSLLVSAYGNFCLGFYNRIKGENRKAIEYHNISISYYQKKKDEDGRVRVLNELGIIYKNLGRYEKSIEYYKEGIEIAEKIKSSRLADVYSNLAMVVSLLDKKELALEYLFKGLELEDDTIGKQIVLLNIGCTYKENAQDSLAMVYFQKALKVCDNNNLATYYRNDIIHNIALELIEKSEYEKGLSYLFEIAEYEEAKNNKRDLAYTYLSISSAYKAMQNHYEAIKFLNKCVDVSIETETNDQLILAYSHLSDIYKSMDNYKKALIFHTKCTSLKDSLFNIDKVKNNESLIAEFEAKRKENEILLLKKEKELHETEIENNKIVRNATISISLLSLLAVFAIAFFYKQKLNTEKVIALKNEEINKQEIFALLQEKQVNAIESEIEGRNNERKRIAQELHDGVGGNLASIKLNLANIIGNNTNDKLRAVMRNIDDTYKEVREISHDLISVRMENHSFSYLVKKFLNEILVGKMVKLNLNLYPESELDKLPNEIKVELYRIIQELMSNVIKYSEADMVDVQITRGNKYLSLMLEDNGIGFDTSVPTSGIGLKNIRSRIKSLNGVCTIESTIGRLTLVNIEIPLA